MAGRLLTESLKDKGITVVGSGRDKKKITKLIARYPRVIPTLQNTIIRFVDEGEIGKKTAGMNITNQIDDTHEILLTKELRTGKVGELTNSVDEEGFEEYDKPLGLPTEQVLLHEIGHNKGLGKSGELTVNFMNKQAFKQIMDDIHKKGKASRFYYDPEYTKSFVNSKFKEAHHLAAEQSADIFAAQMMMGRGQPTTFVVPWVSTKEEDEKNAGEGFRRIMGKRRLK
jgi:hypothetical protein